MSLTARSNALMESAIGLYKTELIDHDRTRSWTGRAEVERETASWVHWYNTTRIHRSIGKMSPIEFEEHYRLANPARPDYPGNDCYRLDDAVDAIAVGDLVAEMRDLG